MSNVMISNPADRKKIKDALQEISDAMTRIAAEKDLIKEIVADVSDNFQMEKKTVNKMARVYHKQNFINEQQAFDEFETLYTNILNKYQKVECRIHYSAPMTRTPAGS